MKYDFFFSHSSRLDTRTNRLLRAIADRLEGYGCKVFLDVNSMRKGALLGQAIRTAISEARVGVIMYTRASADSKWVEYEIWRMFQQKDKGAMSVWVLCPASWGNFPDWASPDDVLRVEDNDSPEKVADELLLRYKTLRR